MSDFYQPICRRNPVSPEDQHQVDWFHLGRFLGTPFRTAVAVNGRVYYSESDILEVPGTHPDQHIIFRSRPDDRAKMIPLWRWDSNRDGWCRWPTNTEVTDEQDHEGHGR